MIDHQRIHFNGQHVATGWPSKCKAFALSPRALHTTLGALFTAVGAEMVLPDITLGGIAFISTDIVSFCLLRYGIHEVKKHLGTKRICSWKETRRKVINIKPDKDTLPSDPKWLSYAKEVRGLAAFELGALSLISIALPFYATTKNISLALCALGIGGVILPMAIDATITLRRWNRVIRGEWVVEDPKPIKQKAKEHVKVKARFGILVPDV